MHLEGSKLFFFVFFLTLISFTRTTGSLKRLFRHRDDNLHLRSSPKKQYFLLKLCSVCFFNANELENVFPQYMHLEGSKLFFFVFFLTLISFTTRTGSSFLETQLLLRNRLLACS